MNSITVNTYDELIEQVKEITSRLVLNSDDYRTAHYFRGHADKDWKLLPTLLRDKNSKEDKELLDLLPINENDKNKIMLATAQHYGRKTRCLDFTRNYKVALYFACNPNDLNYDKDGAIFILEKYYHLPNWFTNYLVYYVAIDNRSDLLGWNYAREILQKAEIVDELKRTKRSLAIDDIECEIQWYLSKGFMVDFRKNDFGIERIKKQEAALYYFGSKFYGVDENGKRYYQNIDSLRYWSNQNMLYIDLHTLSDPQLQDGICTKIIIPQRLKKEIYEKIEIEASDLGL